jgi:hypothetical protein
MSDGKANGSAIAGDELEMALSRYHDDDADLEEELRAAVEAGLRRGDDGSGGDLVPLRSGLVHLGDLLRVAAEERAADLDSEALFAAIAADVAAAEVREAEAKVVPLRDRAEARARRRPEARDLGNPTVWIAGTLALAAAALLTVIVWPQSPMIQPITQGTEVIGVDFGESTGTIFSLEGEGGEHYAVVWISDEKVPMEPVETDAPIAEPERL